MHSSIHVTNVRVLLSVYFSLAPLAAGMIIIMYDDTMVSSAHLLQVSLSLPQPAGTVAVSCIKQGDFF